MRPTRWLLAGAALSAIVLGGHLVSRGVGAAPDPVPAPRVAVVDMFEVLSTGSAHDQVEAKRRQAMQAIDDLAKTRSRELDEIKARLEMTPVASRRPVFEELQRKKALADVDLKLRDAQAQQEYADNLETLYAEAKSTVAAVARERGFNLVLSKSDEKVSLDDPSRFRLFVAMHPVLYSDRSLDITDEVKTRLAASHPPTPGSTPPAALPPSTAPSMPPSSPPPSGPTTVPPVGPIPPPSTPAMR